MSKQKDDLLSPELRKAEEEIDNYFLLNPLVKLHFANAAWNILAFSEDCMLRPLLNQDRYSRYDIIALVDNLMNFLKYPMFWLFKTCISGGNLKSEYNDKYYEASQNLLDLGRDYGVFWALFTYASNGYITLKIRDNFIESSQELLADSRYEAYDRLISINDRSYIKQFISNYEDFVKDLKPTVKLEKSTFRYNLNYKIVGQVIEHLNSIYSQSYLLPENWEFSKYSLSEFRKVFDSVTAIAFIHYNARIIAADKGCPALGFNNSIFLSDYNSLIRRVSKYSNVVFDKVNHILTDLTFGFGDSIFSDIALQPLVKLNNSTYAVTPNLWMNNASERNFTVLINRSPEDRKIYLSLVDEKESLMRNKIIEKLSHKKLRMQKCKFSKDYELPDIDLAIISDSEKAVLLLEIKWFISPAEPREIIEKSEELKKGIDQLSKLKQAFKTSPNIFNETIKIDSDYQIALAVISSSSIGISQIQNPDVPIINADHLIKKINASKSICEVIKWLSNRDYLPEEHKHFEIIFHETQIGKWKTKWYGLKSLVTEDFLPL